MADKWFAVNWQNTFAEVVVEYYNKISLQSANIYGPDGFSNMRLLLDAALVNLGGFIPEIVRDEDIELPFKSFKAGNEDQIYSIRKVGLLSKSLYLIGAIHNVRYPKKFIKDQYVFPDYDSYMRDGADKKNPDKQQKKRTNVRTTIASKGRVPFDIIIVNHNKFIPNICIGDNSKTLSFHVEMMFGMLYPYLTEERWEQWNQLDRDFVNSRELTLERLELCSKIMNQASFIWQKQGHSYEGDSYFDPDTEDLNDYINQGGPDWGS